MSTRPRIAFADAGAQLAGVAIAGAGTLLALDGELTAAAAGELAGEAPAWTLAAAGAYELALEALGEPARLADGANVWLCRATGAVQSRTLDGLATIVSGGAEDGVALERSVSIAFAPTLAFVLASRRPRGARDHGEEQLEAVAFRGEPAVAAPIERPRLSTTYDAAELPRHAGIELWEGEGAELAVRIGGEAIISGELLHADGARSRIVFMAWLHDRHHAAGSYTITTPAEPGEPPDPH